jgi:hypothetical protein
MDLVDLRDLLRAEDARASAAVESILAFETTEWVTVYHDDIVDYGGGSLVAVLLRDDALDRARGQAGIGLSPGDFRPGFTSFPDGEGRAEYHPVGSGDIVPLVRVRPYNEMFARNVELAEDFRLCWNLYEDRDAGEWVTVDNVGDRVVVAKRHDGDILVAKRYLRRYQAARQLHLSLQICVVRQGGDEIEHLDELNVDVDEGDVRLAYHCSEGIPGLTEPYLTRLVGKRIIAPPPIAHAGLPPYDVPKGFEDFIIGIDPDGNPVEHTCDPDKLANAFDKNPDAVRFLTPVFFRRDVLAKYYANPDCYEITDGHLSAPHSFGLRSTTRSPTTSSCSSGTSGDTSRATSSGTGAPATWRGRGA